MQKNIQNPKHKPPSLSKQLKAGVEGKRRRNSKKDKYADFNSDNELEEIEFKDLDTLRHEENELVTPSAKVSKQNAETDEDDEVFTSSIREMIERIDDQRVLCKICRKPKGLSFPIKGGKITNLHKHKCFKDLRKNTTEKQLTLTGQLVYGPPLPPDKEKRIFRTLKQWVVNHEQPFLVVENPDFRALVHELNSQYRPPCVKTMRKAILKDMKALEEWIKNHLQNIDSFCIAFDAFVSDADDHFLDIDITWYDSKIGKLYSKVLRMACLNEVVHVTGEEIAKKLKEVLHVFGKSVSDVLVFTADLGSNGLKAVDTCL